MNNLDVIARQLNDLPEKELARLQALTRWLTRAHAGAVVPSLAAESALSKDWLTLEEDEAWANL